MNSHPGKTWSEAQISGLISLVLAGITLLIYWPVIHCGFVNYDDPDYVTANPRVQSGLSLANVAWAFTTGQASNWHPLTWLSLMLDGDFFGERPAGYHFTNLLLHAANAVLLFWLLRRLTGARVRSALVAALFAWHPLNVETVAWVAERKSGLSTCFGWLALLAYAGYVRAGEASQASLAYPVPAAKSPGPLSARWIYYGLSLLAFTLGLLSKPMLVTWPFVLLLLDYWPLDRWQAGRSWSLVREKIPFLVLAAGASVVTFLVQRHGHAVAALGRIPLDARCENAIISYVRYLGKLVWPADLAVFYPLPGHWPLAMVLLAGGVLAGLSGLIWASRRRHPYLVTGWLWYLGTLVPVIGLVQVGGQALADRYTYVPAVGIWVMVVWGAFDIGRQRRWLAGGLMTAGAAALVIGMGLTIRQMGYWQNSETLFRHALAVTQDNWIAHSNLGAALDQRGQSAEAIGHFQAALQTNPEFAEARNNLGSAREKLGQTAAAINEYQQALKIDPDNAEIHNNLGAALDQSGRADEAIQEYQAALGRNPDLVAARDNLGVAWARQGQWAAATGEFEAALRLKPGDADTRNNLGAVLNEQGRTDEAIQQFQQALKVKPDYADARNNLGLAYAKKGQMAEAISQYQAALHGQPDNPAIHKNLAQALDQTGQIALAVNEYQAALERQPNDAELHNHLGVDLARLGRFEAAAGEFQAALQLRPEDAEAENNLGYLWMDRGEHLDQALELVSRALKADPHNPTTLDSLGCVLLKLNRPAEGLDYLRQAIQYSPQADASLYEHLGDIYAALQQRDPAAGAWRQSLAISPSAEVEQKLAGLGGP